MKTQRSRKGRGARAIWAAYPLSLSVSILLEVPPIALSVNVRFLIQMVMDLLIL